MSTQPQAFVQPESLNEVHTRARFVAARQTSRGIESAQGELLARACPINALDEDAGDAFVQWLESVVETERSETPAHAKASAIVIRSGWKQPTHDDLSDAPLWLPSTRAQWLGFVQRAEAACVQANLTMVLHPRATDVVSDTPGMLTAVRSSSRLRVLLDPAALLTEGMRAQWDDHAKRYAQLAEGLLAMRALFGVVVPKGELASASFEKGLAGLSAEVALEKPTHGAASMNDLSLPVVYCI